MDGPVVADEASVTVHSPLTTHLVSDDGGTSYHVSHVHGPCYTPPDAYAPRPTAHLDVLYLDAYIAIVDKPAFLPTENTRYIKDSVRARLVTELTTRGEPSDELRLPHRLDYETSGLIVFARSAEAMRSLARQFAARTVRKAYVADVRGRPPATHGVVDMPISADADRLPLQRVDYVSGKPARTQWEVLETPGGAGADSDSIDVCRLRLLPESGRRHQLRLHCLSLGCPMVNDTLYSPWPSSSSINDGSKQLHLHAAELKFIHPETQVEVSFQSEPPF
jgi:tRNA pseudouridine32 synthase/23S rRNA pseudouridine746 synthase